MSEERFRSLRQLHESFKTGVDRQAGLNDEYFIQQRLDELKLLSLSMRFAPDYQEIRSKFESGIPLELNEAAGVAALEAGALFLDDPFQLFVHSSTPTVYRQMRTLELMGELHPDSLNGNILLIGSHVTRHEVQALNAGVSISEPAHFEAYANEMLGIISKFCFLKDEEYVEKLMRNFEFVKSWSESPRGYEIKPRLNDEQKIVCVEPDREALATYLIQCTLPSELNFRNVRVVPRTLGEYFEELNPDEKFSLIVLRRTDPDMWSEKLAVKDVRGRTHRADEMMMDVLLQRRSISELRKDFSQDRRSDKELKRSIHENFREIINNLARISEVGTQVYVSVGWGNIAIEMNEVSQRGLLIGRLGQDFAGYDMKPFYLDITELQNTGVWLMEGDVDISSVIAEFTANTFSRTGIRVESGERRDNSSRKKRRRH